MHLLKSGKGDEVMKELREACKAVKGDPEPEFYIEMALVEVLICLVWQKISPLLEHQTLQIQA